jgi:hypothetical protein
MTIRHSCFADLRRVQLFGLVALSLGRLASTILAQEPTTPIRPLGAIIAVSAESLSDASSIRVLGDGRVLVNDPSKRRLLLLDSTLRRAAVLADTTSATAKAYGDGLAGLTSFSGDSSLISDRITGAFLVIDQTGKIARIIATPGNARAMMGGPVNPPLGFDHAGHLLLRAPPTIFLSLLSREFVGDTLMRGPDSSAILRQDVATRRIDTLAMLKAPRIRQAVTRRVNGGTGRAALNPMPSSDDWTVLNDGTIAIVRVADYHIDWIRPDGHMTSSPKIPTQWIRMTDSMKVATMDSLRVRDSAAGIGRDDSAVPLAQRRVYVEPSDLPDFRPPFTSGFARADAEGDVWIRTSGTAPIAGSAVYDVVNHDGELVDRVQISNAVVLAGFGPGVAYLLSHGDGTVRLSKVRIH